MLKDMIKLNSKWAIRKFANDQLYLAHLPYEISRFEGNLLLNEGKAEAHNLAMGSGGVKWDNTNAYLGVGTSSQAEVVGDTGLIAAVLYKGMEATYPTWTAPNLTTFRAIFTSGEANVAWEEFSASNTSGGDSGVNLNRKTSSEGTKTAGQTWTLDLVITWS